MEAMAGRIVREGLSVRAVEELVMLDQTGAASGVRESRKSGSRGGKPRSQGMADVVGDISRRLSDVLDTRVTVVGMKSAKSNGRVVVEVADVEDLRRIADLVERLRP